LKLHDQKPSFMQNLLLFLFSLLSISALAQSPDYEGEQRKLLAQAEVLFDFGKHAITPTADSILQGLGEQLSGEEPQILEITAHTDAIGSPGNNLALSQRRAASVKTHLGALGIPDSLISIATYGESQPVADNDTEEGRQRNRRATVRLFRLIPMTILEGKVQDQESGKGIQASVVLHSKEYRDSFATDSSGLFRRLVPQNMVMGMDIFAPGYFYDTRMFKTKERAIPKLEVILPKVKKGEAIDVKNLYFVGNKAILLPGSKPELPKILKFMQLNPFIQVEIAGHINRPNEAPVAESTWDFQLSVRRAKMVHDYLIENNIEPERISFKGYGNSQMKYPQARTEEQMRWNRRVELRVLHTGERISEEGAPIGD
jgi:outer membrane protein OmpA-like peptidoglycan-associated protein